MLFFIILTSVIGFGLMGFCAFMLHRNNCIYLVHQRMNQRWWECSRHVLIELRNHLGQMAYHPELHAHILEESDGLYKLHKQQPSYDEMMNNPKYWRCWKYEDFCAEYEAELKQLENRLIREMENSV
jgi:hypothetical protein